MKYIFHAELKMKVIRGARKDLVYTFISKHSTYIVCARACLALYLYTGCGFRLFSWPWKSRPAAS